jgi:hypothetical protein
MKDQLKFDTTNAGTIGDSDKVLAGIVSTDGSTLITDTLDGGKQGLDVYVINSISATAGAEKAEDAAHTTGDTGNFVLAVANHTEGALHSADGDYAALQVDDTGRLRVVADLDTTNLAEKAEDAAHSSGDIGNYVLAVRQDTLAASTSADGDYASIKVDSVGSVYTKATDTDALLTTIDGVLDSIKVDTGVIAGDTTSIDSTLTALSKAEDSAHSSGDQGIMPLAVRNDVAGSLADTDGDYAPLQLDASGNLRVTGSFSVNAEKNEDDAHSSGDSGNFVLAVRQDTLASSTSADGDYMAFKGNSKGEIYTIDTDGNALLTTIDADTGVIAGDTTSMDATLTALSKAEDAAHSSGDQGIQMLAVRQDTLAASVSADGDYGSLKLNADGRLYVTADISNDPGTANTAVSAAATSVAATATDLRATDLADRKYMFVYNNGNRKIYIGGSGVTTAAGFPISPGSALEMRIGAAIDLHAIGDAAGQDTRILEFS